MMVSCSGSVWERDGVYVGFLESPHLVAVTTSEASSEANSTVNYNLRMSMSIAVRINGYRRNYRTYAGLFTIS